MREITIHVIEEGNIYVSHCLDFDIASQGDSIAEAIENIKEAVSEFLDLASPTEIQSRLSKSGHIEQVSVEGV